MGVPEREDLTLELRIEIVQGAILLSVHSDSSDWTKELAEKPDTDPSTLARGEREQGDAVDRFLRRIRAFTRRDA